MARNRSLITRMFISASGTCSLALVAFIYATLKPAYWALYSVMDVLVTASAVRYINRLAIVVKNGRTLTNIVSKHTRWAS